MLTAYPEVEVRASRARAAVAVCACVHACADVCMCTCTRTSDAQCGTSEHTKYKVLGVIGCSLYVGGFPLLVYAALSTTHKKGWHTNRRAISAVGGFFTKYEASSFWYELVPASVTPDTSRSFLCLPACNFQVLITRRTIFAFIAVYDQHPQIQVLVEHACEHVVEYVYRHRVCRHQVHAWLEGLH